MRELVVISGKGGTGKTSVVASFAALAENAVLADCDVDAADLHLVLAPRVVERADFSGGSRARVVAERCTACGRCAELCRFDAIAQDGPAGAKAEKTFRVDPIACEGCGVCAWFCGEEAIEFGPVTNGEWYVSETRHGLMVHARLGVAEENSGKLVSLVRQRAKEIAAERGAGLVLIDGSPGIGCPVIASVTGADLVLVVTEPTPSGLHDLHRVADLTAHFGIDTLVCVNKWDLNEPVTAEIESQAERRGLRTVARVRYDPAVTDAQIREQSIAEYAETGAGEDVRAVWRAVWAALDAGPRASARAS